MVIIPAIDIKEGRCVRLVQGDMDRETVYAQDPVAQAQKWEQAGATLIHIVDLDGAVEGLPKNAALIGRICRSVKCAVQLGGGIRNEKIADEYLGIGIGRIVLGTLLIKDMPLAERIVRAHPNRVLAGIDGRDGMVAGHGWVEVSAVRAVDMAKRIADWPLAGIVFTDISRDGMMEGVNLEETAKMAVATGLPLIASGGVSGRADLKALAAMPGVEAAIVGKALYTGAIDAASAIREFQFGG
jgi:phosphoribosylformimino-5-aminoimidazole carboxamide ribotide isomerase